MSGAPVLASESANDAAGMNYDPKDEETVMTIKELLETRVRPAVAQDGGDITFHGFRDGVVYLHMRGACAGCPSSTATLRHGIENCCGTSAPTCKKFRPSSPSNLFERHLAGRAGSTSQLDQLFVEARIHNLLCGAG